MLTLYIFITLQWTQSGTHVYIFQYDTMFSGAGGSVVGWGAMLQAARLRVRIQVSLDVFNSPIPSSRNMALGFTQHLTKTKTRNLPGA
jgi:hypothetical protein